MVELEHMGSANHVAVMKDGAGKEIARGVPRKSHMEAVSAIASVVRPVMAMHAVVVEAERLIEREGRESHTALAEAIDHYRALLEKQGGKDNVANSGRRTRGNNKAAC